MKNFIGNIEKYSLSDDCNNLIFKKFDIIILLLLQKCIVYNLKYLYFSNNYYE